MRAENGFTAAVAIAITLAAAGGAAAQGTPAPGTFRALTPFPGQKRPPADPAVVARGKTLYGISCAGCHGPDLRGGDQGGPNLLRSQLVASDNDGELILPVIQGSRQNTGMPAIKMSPEDAGVISTYIHSVATAIGRQGTPPVIGVAAPSIVVGNAAEGKAYFAVKCGGCHSATGDLRGIAARIANPKALQNAWVAGSARTGGGGGAAREESSRRTVTAVITMPSGEKVEGRLIRVDDFLVSVALPDGSSRSFSRDAGVLVDIRDPMKAHRELLAVYTDTNIHDVTAYLVTLK